MISQEYKNKVIDMFNQSGMCFTQSEVNNIEYADFGLNNIESEGLNLIIYENNERYCAKEMVLLPGQICPEHKHPTINGVLGKQETFRCRKGSVYLFVEGEDTGLYNDISLPEGKQKYYTVKNGIFLKEGEQFTIKPDTKHWFVSGKEGAVISEFSSTSHDDTDIFTDPEIIR
ncbi:D-lyxose/D-mannose family sugar isomerase [Allofustis seminis]|uniref:D-lyxose/D-mannose family sugar isomerase n=1 Tax=Allofustis seminis TaxID=166939 RepID=UPI0003731FF7|nr:D-lyxose/D-mannose family sugar isomerase [Allofustis seminis]